MNKSSNVITKATVQNCLNMMARLNYIYANAVTFVLPFQQAVAAELFHVPSKEVSRENVSI